MANTEHTRHHRLQQTLTRQSSLSFTEARSRLPELVMAELAGDDVEEAFGEVLIALDQYPVLAEEYAIIMAEMYDELAE